jgi:hypothetical protein
MATQKPVILSPGFAQQGEGSRRMAAVMFNDSVNMTPALVIPKNIGATTFTLDPFLVVGFNTFMVILNATVANISVPVSIIDPRDQVTVLATRTLGPVVAGSGNAILNFGFGSAISAGGADVFVYLQIAFTGAGANATISAFPGLWGTVR